MNIAQSSGALFSPQPGPPSLGPFAPAPWTPAVFFKCGPIPHQPFARSSRPVIGEMSGANVNFSPFCWSGFLQGAGKWIKTSEPIVFVALLKSAALNLSVSDRDGSRALLAQFQVHGKLYRCTDLPFMLFGKYHSVAHNVFSHMFIQGIVWNE